MDGGAWWVAVHGVAKSDTTEQLHFHFSLPCIGEGNGNPLQCSCLENSRDGGAWWAAVYEVTQSRTRLKWLSGSSRKRKKCQERVCTEEMPHEATTRKEPSARWEGSKASPETNAVSTLVLDFSLRNCKKMNLCCLRPPVCDILSQQPKKTNWDSLMT